METIEAKSGTWVGHLCRKIPRHLDFYKVGLKPSDIGSVWTFHSPKNKSESVGYVYRVVVASETEPYRSVRYGFYHEQTGLSKPDTISRKKAIANLISVATEWDDGRD